jgi:hypothetical protein
MLLYSNCLSNPVAFLMFVCLLHLMDVGVQLRLFLSCWPTFQEHWSLPPSPKLCNETTQSHPRKHEFTILNTDWRTSPGICTPTNICIFSWPHILLDKPCETISMEQNLPWGGDSRSADQKFSVFIEYECSISCSQEPTVWTDSVKSSQIHYTLSI